MPKTITSPVKRFPGTVTISEPLNFPQAAKIEDAIKEMNALGETVTMLQTQMAWLPAIFACVEKWGLAGIPEQPTMDTFPATPARSVAELISWLITEISALFREEVEIPPE